MPAGPFTRCRAEPAHSPGCSCKAWGAIRAASAVLSGTCRWLKRDSGHSAPKADPRQDVQPLEGRLPLALEVSQGRDQRHARRPVIRDWVSILMTFRRFLQNLDGIRLGQQTLRHGGEGEHRNHVLPVVRPARIHRRVALPPSILELVHAALRGLQALGSVGALPVRRHLLPVPARAQVERMTQRAQPQACTGVQGNQAKLPDGPALDS